MHPYSFAPVRRWLLLLSGLLVMACGAPGDDRPDDLLDEDRMVGILTDIHLAETRVSRLGLAAGDSATIVYKRLEREVFRKHKVNPAVYENSYVYYSSHPREMEAVYKRIVEELKKQLDTKSPAKS